MNGKQTTAFVLTSFRLLAGCSRKPHHDDTLMPVRLATLLQARSAIDVFEDLPVASVASRQVDNPGEVWLGIAHGGRSTFTPSRYYPPNGSTLYLHGLYPPAEVESSCVHYALTGSEDLILVDVLAGSLSHLFNRGNRACGTPPHTGAAQYIAELRRESPYRTPPGQLPTVGCIQDTDIPKLTI